MYMEKDFELTYKLKKSGERMYYTLATWTKFMLKHKWLYYTLSFTWGLPTTLLGLLLSLVLIFTKKKKYYWVYYHECFGKDWGGFSLGLTLFKDKDEHDEYIIKHEFGHTFQNTLLGPFFLFFVAIPSSIRYWYHTIRDKKNLPNKPYDCIWFEASATDAGEYAVRYLKAEEEYKPKPLPEEVFTEILDMLNGDYTLQVFHLYGLTHYNFLQKTCSREIVLFFAIDERKKKLALRGQVYKMEKRKLILLLEKIKQFS